MPVLGKTARVARVWLAALLALLAGSPRVQCRCPDGRLKPFCLGFLFRGAALVGCGSAAKGQTASCDGCCHSPGAPPAEEAEPPCCPHCHRRQTGDTPGGASVAGPGCVRTLAQPAYVSLTPSDQGPLAGLVSAALLAPPGAPALPLSSGHGPVSGQAHLLAPPPTDLVTALQRFLI